MTRRIDKPDTDADVELRGYLDAELRPCFVMVAGAGSGKTTSLVKALYHIGKTYGGDLRRHRQRVACITYTEVAVEEIWGDVGNDPLFHVSTIHSFLWSLVKPFQKDIAKWVKQHLERKLLELQEQKQGFGPRVQQKTRDKNDQEIKRIREQLCVIGAVRRYRYEKASDYSEGLLGHDDIIKMVPQMIKDKPLLASLLAQQYPFFFVDESQDTFPEVVHALKVVARQQTGQFCLGFFGDPMQKIYMSGIGDIEEEPGWKRITKPENFRCSASVLSMINKIRAQGDGLQQTRGRHEMIDDALQPVIGSAKLFVLPADAQRTQNLQRVRSWLADQYADPLWSSDQLHAGVRILVIVHRMAAERLGFAELYAAFHDNAPESLQSDFAEGTAWPLKPFLDVLLPLVSALEENHQFEVISLLRSSCPKFDKEHLVCVDDFPLFLQMVKTNVLKLASLMSPTGSATVLDVLRLAHEAEVIRLDERLREYIYRPQASTDMVHASSDHGVEEGDKIAEEAAIVAYLACPVKQLWGYRTYITDQSPYSTQQGVKGAEFDRVLVVIDDEEGRHFQFSYEKLFGLKEPSSTDLTNQAQNKETVFDRTRRLFYVCCSRATKDLAVVLYTANVHNALGQLTSAALVPPIDIHTLADIS